MRIEIHTVETDPNVRQVCMPGHTSPALHLWPEYCILHICMQGYMAESPGQPELTATMVVSPWVGGSMALISLNLRY